MEQTLLEQYVKDGNTIAEISKETGKSKTSVRHWLTKYGLKTTGKAGAKPENTIVNGMKTCNTCNKTLPVSEFRERKDRPGTLQPFCKPCSTKEVVNRYFANKKSCIQYKGNTCEDCGLQAHDDNLKMFDFHHLEPEHKDFNISDVRGQSYTSVLRELDKCALLCANCHTKRHLDMKLEEGYHNKLEGNTERFKEVRHEKLTHACKGDIKCSKCGYDDCEEALIISFQGEDKKFYKYNRNPENWSEEFKVALDNANILCKNCHRVAV